MATETHPAALPEQELLKECQLKRLKRSGPGGQRRNKVETAVQIEHTPSGLVAEANESRSPQRNQSTALQRLKIELALQIRMPPHSPSDRWKQRCPSGKISINPEHADYPAILAEALDHIWHHQGEVKTAADELGCSASQLIKLLKRKPAALKLLNDYRAEQGRHRLK